MEDLSEIIKNLKEKTQELGIKINFSNLDERINNNLDCFHAFPEIYEFGFQSTSDFENILNLITELWNNYPRKEFNGKTPVEISNIGQEEKRIIQAFLIEAQNKINPDEYNSVEDAEKAIEKFQEKWLHEPQAKLARKTPMEVVLEERKKLGNPRKDFSIKIMLSKIKGKEAMNDENFKQMLFDYACEKYEDRFKEFYDMSYEEFPYDYEELDEELCFKNFIDWLMIEKPLPETGKTIVEEYVEDNPNLDKEMKQKLLQMKNVIRSEFKVISKDKKDLKIEDIKSSKIYDVRLHSDVAHLTKEDILEGRIHPFGNSYRFAGAFLIHKKSSTPFISDVDMMMDIVEGREIKKVENLLLFDNSRLTSILNKFPFQWVDGICDNLSIDKRGKKKDKVKMISYKLYQDLSSILKGIPEKAKQALKLVLNKGGVVKYNQLKEYDDEMSFWWNEDPPTSTIGILRLHVLLIVGKMVVGNKLYKVALVPYEIREKLKSVLS